MNKKSKNTSEPESSAPRDGEARRNFIASAGSIVLGGLVGVVPAALGLFSFLNPLTRKRTLPGAFGTDAAGGEGMLPVCPLDALTVDGPPQRFAVIDNQIDAWNFTPNQPVGSVYIQRLANDELRVFNTTCPHAGCSVSCDGQAFNCPCHNSAFELDGSKLTADSGRENPSPRDLDSLEYKIGDDGKIHVAFRNFYTGREHKEPKA